MKYNSRTMRDLKADPLAESRTSNGDSYDPDDAMEEIWEQVVHSTNGLPETQPEETES